MASRDSARRFHFLREIASGGFGSVYLTKVMHADGFSRIAAVKLLHRRWSENREIAQRMRDEARLLGWLRHRNIVDVIDLTSIDGRAAVIMEYLEAVDLKTVVQSLAERNELMATRAGLEITAFVASALDAAYNRPPFQGEKPLRVIHRDIKPSNIMVDESGAVKVLDFGVARAEFDNRESHTQELQFGSVDYMPPERLFFEPETDLSDVYSLGATLYEVLAGVKLGKAKGRAEKHAAFLEDRLSFLAARNPLPAPHNEALLAMVRAMCAYTPDQRPRAADVVTRCRAMVRAVEGELLTEWAERVIPPLVGAMRDAPPEPNPLNDAVMAEDSILFTAHDVAALERAQALEGGVVVGQEDEVPAEIPRDDARWELLRQAALAEIAAGGMGNAEDDVTRVGGAEPPRKGIGPAPTMVPDEPFEQPGAKKSIYSPPSIAGVVAPRPAAPKPPPVMGGPAPAPPRPPSDVATVKPSAPPIVKPASVPPPVATPLPVDVAPAVPPPPEPPPVLPELTATEAPTTVGPPRTPTAPPPATKVAIPPPPASPRREPAVSLSPAADRRPASIPDPFDEPPPKKRGFLLPAIVGMLFLGAMCAGVGLVGWRAYVMSQASSPAPVAEVKPEATPAGTPDAGPDAVHFVSKAADTQRMIVSCGGKDYQGGAEVAVPGPDAGACSVRVILKDRSRLTASIAAASTGTYTCFDGGAKECTR